MSNGKVKLYNGDCEVEVHSIDVPHLKSKGWTDKPPVKKTKAEVK